MPTIRKQSVKKKTTKKASKKTTKRKTTEKENFIHFTEGVLGRIKPIGFDEDEGIKINIYGRSATGKTTLWATFPKPILAIICSGGNRPGELRSIDTPEYRKTIQQVVLEKVSDIGEIVRHQAETGEYATIVLDHVTSLQDYVLKEVLGLAGIPEQLSWGIAKQQDWGQVAVQVKEVMRSLLNLSCNVVLVAQEREFNVDSDSDLVMPYVASALTPSSVGWLNPAVDYIGQTRIQPKMEIRTKKIGGKTIEKLVPGKGVEYTLRTGPDAVYTTKFRVPKGTELPEEIVDPTYDKIMELIRGKG